MGLLSASVRVLRLRLFIDRTSRTATSGGHLGHLCQTRSNAEVVECVEQLGWSPWALAWGRRSRTSCHAAIR